MNNSQRFSNRVDDYVKARPAYPDWVWQVLAQYAGLTEHSVVADVGAGTGLLSRLFLAHGHKVYAVEPNQAMREAANKALGQMTGYVSVAASAEETTLPAASVDFVVVGQAFHWFDAQRAQFEFARILRPGGQVVLVYNERNHTGSAFQAEYEALLQQFGTDYQAVPHHGIGEAARETFFAPAQSQTLMLDNPQPMDWPMLQARLLSSSYAPAAGSPRYALMLTSLKQVFERHQLDGQINFLYQTKVTFGQLPSGNPVYD